MHWLGLGYAALENWQYLDYLTRPEAYARGFASPVIHMLFASIWGHWIARAHLAGRSIVVPTLVSFAVAALLHGLYDFVVILSPRHAPAFVVIGVLSIWLWRLRVLRALHEEASQER